MLVYFDNRHADPIVRFIQRAITKDGVVPTEGEANALSTLVKGIEQEKRSVPYQLWQRNQQPAATAPAAPSAAASTKKKAGGRRGK